MWLAFAEGHGLSVQAQGFLITDASRHRGRRATAVPGKAEFHRLTEIDGAVPAQVAGAVWVIPRDVRIPGAAQA